MTSRQAKALLCRDEYALGLTRSPYWFEMFHRALDCKVPEQWGNAIRQLLTGETGGLDCGTLDTILVDNLTAQGFDAT